MPIKCVAPKAVIKTGDYRTSDGFEAHTLLSCGFGGLSVKRFGQVADIPLYDHFDMQTKTPYRNARVMRKIMLGKYFPKIFIATHQHRHLQDQTAQFLETASHLEAAPRFLLHYCSFPSSSRRLAQQASLMPWSPLGRLHELHINASEIHIAGGFLGVCLSRTIADIIQQFLRSSRTQITFFVYFLLIYNTRFEGEDSNKDSKETIMNSQSALIKFCRELLTPQENWCGNHRPQFDKVSDLKNEDGLVYYELSTSMNGKKIKFKICF